MNIIGFLVEFGFAKSKSEAKRLVIQNAIKVNDKPICPPLGTKEFEQWKVIANLSVRTFRNEK